MTQATSPTVNANAGLSVGLLPLAHVLCAAATDGEYGIRRAVRSRGDDELESMARDIPRYERLNLAFLGLIGLPPPKGPGLWVGAVLPAIKEELSRRRRPPRPQGQGRIAQLKARLRLEDVASRFTTLKLAGPDRLKGPCPLHSEKTPSFVIYVDSQKWHCFGACAAHGDVIDLMERLSR